MNQPEPAPDARVLDCFRSVFPERSDDELRVLDQATVDDWDSLASLSLLTVIEEEFEITFDDDAIAEMTTFPAVCDAVAARTASSE